MLKTITGEPRSGKSYLIVHLLLKLYFRWCPDIFQWLPRDDVPQPVILTNIDGLRIPHVKLQDVVKELGIPLHSFLTKRHFLPWMRQHGKPVVLVIDEAQANFPYDFKDDKFSRGGVDPEGSVFYFFEHHGHDPIDIYLLAQQWTRMSQDIVKNSEYQIQAIPETYRRENTLRYKYIDPKNMMTIETQSIKKDPKVFMAYRSSNGEHKTNKKTPVKKLVVIVSALLIGFVVMAITTFRMTMPSAEELAKVQNTPGSPGTPSAPSFTPGQFSKPDPGKMIVKSAPMPRAAAAPSTLMQPGTEEKTFTSVKLGGLWIGDKLVAVDFFGTLLKMRDFPYSYVDEKTAVYASIPDEVLIMVKPGIWVDSHRVISGPTDEFDKESSFKPPSTFRPQS